MGFRLGSGTKPIFGVLLLIELLFAIQAVRFSLRGADKV